MALEKQYKAVNHTLQVKPVGYMQQVVQRPRKSKDSKTPLCFVSGTDNTPIGHDWRYTEIGRVRTCQRCKLVQFKNRSKRWENKSKLKDLRHKNESNQLEKLWEQMEMWEQEEKAE